MKIEKWDEINGAADTSDKLQPFLDSGTDCYAILQLRRSEETTMERFTPYWQLEHMDITPNIDHYETVYVDALPQFTDRTDLLEGIFQKFNIDRPSDFTGHSLSVSDIVAIKAGGVVSCHYVDSIGFKELQNFIKPENYLKNAEMAMEDDCGMIDGIINNGSKRESTQNEPSILEQLKKKPEPPCAACDKPRKRGGVSIMPDFTGEEITMLYLYDSGSLADTIATLEDMQREITRSERHLLKLTASTLDKLAQISEQEYENLLDRGL